MNNVEIEVYQNYVVLHKLNTNQYMHMSNEEVKEVLEFLLTFPVKENLLYGVI